MEIKVNAGIVPNKEEANEKTVAELAAEKEADLDKEYVDKRHITISLVHNYSSYRRANMKTLGQRKETIGSSVKSCRVLASNKGEVEAYFPALIGISSNHPDFTTRVKSWLSNIQVTISEDNVSFNTSFVYNTKRDYLEFKAKEDAINAEFDKVDRSNLTAVKEAVARKVDALNNLESGKYKVGHPENLEEYLIYRHCLLYKDVAKDLSLINADPTLRFYIKDEVKEQEKQNKLILERKKAMKHFMELSATDDKFRAVYIQMIVNQGANVHEALLQSRLTQENQLMNFANTSPDKFNKLYSDKNVSTKAFIELLIARGELVRPEFNQQISTVDGTFIGSNINEAVAYFDNPANIDIRTAYENKLKLV